MIQHCKSTILPLQKKRQGVSRFQFVVLSWQLAAGLMTEGGTVVSNCHTNIPADFFR